MGKARVTWDHLKEKTQGEENGVRETRREPFRSTPWLVAAGCTLGITTLLLSGCSSTREVTKSPRGAIEQLLLTQSLERTFDDFAVSGLKGASVVVEAEGLAPDVGIVKAMLREELGRQGLQVREQKEQAQYVVKLTVHSIGTEQAETLVGMPPTSGGFLPIALPELALYKVYRQKGYARYSLGVFELATGKMVLAMPWRAGSAYYNYFTVFFFFSFPATDLVLPPIPDSMVEQIIVNSPEAILEEDRQEPTHEVSPGPL